MEWLLQNSRKSRNEIEESAITYTLSNKEGKRNPISKHFFLVEGQHFCLY
jgi:hypothetical protein